MTSDNPFLEELDNMLDEGDPLRSELPVLKKDKVVTYDGEDADNARNIIDTESGGSVKEVPQSPEKRMMENQDPVLYKPTENQDREWRQVQEQRKKEAPKQETPKKVSTKKKKVEPKGEAIYTGAAREAKPIKSAISDDNLDSAIKDVHTNTNSGDKFAGNIEHGNVKANRYKPKGDSTSQEENLSQHRDEQQADDVEFVHSYKRHDSVRQAQKELQEAIKAYEKSKGEDKTNKYGGKAVVEDKAKEALAAARKKLEEALENPKKSGYLDYEKESVAHHAKQPDWKAKKGELMAGKGLEGWDEATADEAGNKNPNAMKRVFMDKYEDLRRRGLVKVADSMRDSILANIEAKIEKSLYSDFSNDLVELVKSCMDDKSIRFDVLAKSFESEVEVDMITDKEFKKSRDDFNELAKAFNEAVDVINSLADEVQALRKAVEENEAEGDFDFGDDEEKPKEKKKKPKPEDEEEEEDIDKAGEEGDSAEGGEGETATSGGNGMNKAGKCGGVSLDEAGRKGSKALKSGAHMDATVKHQSMSHKEAAMPKTGEIGKDDDGEDVEMGFPGATVDAERPDRINKSAGELKDKDIQSMDWADYVKTVGVPPGVF